MQIKLNSDLSNLIMRNNLQPTPKRSSLINQYPAKNYKENQLNVNNLGRSPARSASRKTLNSKEESLHVQNHNQNESRNRMKSRRDLEVRTCQNHQEQEGQFHINIQGEDLYYCEKCAVKLKHQGFPIRRVESNGSDDSRKREHQHRNTLLAAHSRYEGHPQFETLKRLLSAIYESEQRMISPEPSRFIEEFFKKLTLDFDHFYDGVQQMVRSKRQAGRAELQSLSESILHKWKGPEFSEAFEEIRMMKKDIEENVDSIIGEVQEDTFEQCVDSYRDRLEELNKIADQRLVETQKIKANYERFLENQVHSLRDDIQKLQPRTISCSSQNVLSSQAEDLSHPEEAPVRGPFRNLFNHQKDKSRKRLISRK